MENPANNQTPPVVDPSQPAGQQSEPPVGQDPQPNLNPNIDPPSYGELVNIAQESGSDLVSKLQPLANANNAILMAFIAPSMGKKVSPADFSSAYINLWDELGFEEALRDIKRTSQADKLFLLVESPGGIVDYSYKIAYKLRNSFSQIISFVPHVAASGGALIAMSANKMVMGDMAHLTPIDIQVPYEGNYVSVNRMSSSLAKLVKFFETKQPQQTPYPYRALVDKLDPIIYDDWNSKTNSMIEYTIELLTKAGYPSEKITTICRNFILSDLPHNFVIHKERAIEYGLDVATDEYQNELNCMRWWLNTYMLTAGSDHFIRYIVPS